jgi:hypothetical protein
MGFGHIREELRKRKEINEKRKGVVIFTEQKIFGEMVTRPHDFLRKETAHQGIKSHSQHVSIYYYYYGKDAICKRRKQGRCILQEKEAEQVCFFLVRLSRAWSVGSSWDSVPKANKNIYFIFYNTKSLRSGW